MYARIAPVLVATALMLVSVPLFAKGNTVQVSITGPGLSLPIHSIDPRIVKANVWFGNYVDWEAGPIKSPADDNPEYEVHFWAQIPRGHIEMKYFVQFRWLDDTQRGLLCWPEKWHPWTTFNSSTIHNEASEGNCFYAEKSWGSAVHEVISQGE